MAIEHLVTAICRRAKKISLQDRVTKIRELAAESKEDAAFIRDHFPELYEEASPSSKRSRVG
ncbi:MAG TPA: hypothetical protein VKM93_28770 [Terriglobia bacterium]|nr:hypothetical protein [Terriglobia bacterium]